MMCHSNHSVFVFNWSRTFHLHVSDIDECMSGELCGPNSHCHNTNGSFYCTCQRDYIPTSGTQHFHPERGVRCKGQYEDRKSTLAQVHTKSHALTLTHILTHSYALLTPKDIHLSPASWIFGKSITQYMCNLTFHCVLRSDDREKSHMMLCLCKFYAIQAFFSAGFILLKSWT